MGVTANSGFALLINEIMHTGTQHTAWNTANIQRMLILHPSLNMGFTSGLYSVEYLQVIGMNHTMNLHGVGKGMPRKDPDNTTVLKDL